MRIEPVAMTYNTIYLVESAGERVLVDTGPDYRGARDLLERAFGGDLPQLVVATHAHMDHAGLGRWWQERATPVAIGRADVHLLRGPHFRIPGEFEAFVDYVRHSGAPANIQATVLDGLEARRNWANRAAEERDYPPARPTDRWPTGLRFQPFEPHRLLDDRDQLPAGLQVIACPGHTPGNIVLVNEDHGVLFSGDQLLPDITPTPGVQFVQDESGGWQRFPSLPPFVQSLERLQRMRLARCYPGHGEPFDSVADVIAANLAQVEQRTERIQRELQASGPQTLHALSERLYPRALARRWWQIVATVQGHLDLLAAREQVTHADGLWHAC